MYNSTRAEVKAVNQEEQREIMNKLSPEFHANMVSKFSSNPELLFLSSRALWLVSMDME